MKTINIATIVGTIFSVIAVIIWKPSLIKSLTSLAKSGPGPGKCDRCLLKEQAGIQVFFQVLISEQMLFVLYQGQ